MSYTDLHLACKSGDLANLVQAYESDPSKLNLKDSKVLNIQLGWTPLYRSAISGCLQAARFLLTKGADPNILNHLGESPLHQAADTGNLEIAELLLEYSADPNVQQNEGDTPLHNSAFRGDTEMLKLLLEYHADPNIQNKAGRSPLHYAVDCGFFHCVELMMKFWADPFLVDSTGKNAFDMTTDWKILDCLKEVNEKVAGFDDDRLFLEKCSIGNKEENREDCEIMGRNSCSVERLSEMIKLSKVNTTAASQIHTKPSKFELYPVYGWLESINLGVYYEVVVSCGFYTLESISKNHEHTMEVILPLIKKPGHRDRMGFRILELTKGKPRPSLHKKSRSDFLKCCGISGCSTQAVFHFPSLKTWLDHINMGAYYDNFFESGWDDYESLVLMVNSDYSLTSEKIKKDLKIINERHAQKIIRELEADHLSLFSRHSLRGISYDEPKTVACESCMIY